MAISKTQSDFLNLTRWIAACLVVLEHTRSLLFLDYGQIESPGLVEKAFYFATGFGHEAVVIFFVTSGFLVGGKACDLFQREQFQWRRYLADRASRLYAVLIVAVILGGVLDWVGGHYFNAFGFYTDQTPEPVAVVGGSFLDRLSLRHATASLFMLQEIWLPSFGSNGPLWSLAHEWWYYILFPLLLGVLNGPAASRLACAGLAIFLCWLLTPYILILFGVWLLGVLGWKLNGRRWLSPRLALPVFFATLLMMRLEIHLFPYSNQYLLGLGFSLLLNSFVNGQRRFWLQEPSRWLADFSYSLYLIHLPVILCIVAMLFTAGDRVTRYELSFTACLIFMAVVMMAYCVSFVVSLFTEAKTGEIRDWLYRVGGVRTSTVVANAASLE